MMRLFWAFLLVAAGISASAWDRLYQTGSLTNVSDRTIDIGGPFPVHLYYVLQIEASDRTYSVVIEKRPYKLEWPVNSSIEFRLSKQEIFLKRPNGKELKAHVRGVIQGTRSLANSDPNPSPPTVTSVEPLRLPKFDRGNRGILIGLDFVRGGDKCVGLSATLESGNFFEGFKRQNTASGKQFRNKSGKVETFPERVAVRVLLSIWPCVHSEDTHLHEGAVQPEFIFDTNFVESLRFEGFWKKGFEMKKADLEVLTEAQVRAPLPLANDGTWWEYELEIWSRDVPLTDSLVVNVVSPDGKLVSRFAVNL